MKNIFILIALYIIPITTQAEENINNLYKTTSDEIQKYLVPQIETNKMPRIGDEGISNIFLNISKTKEKILQTETLGNSTPYIESICKNTTKAIHNYNTAGIESKTLPAELEEKIRITREEIVKNSHLYQNEISKLLSLDIACQAKQINSILKEFNKTKPEDLSQTKKSTIPQIQRAVLTKFIGAILIAHDPLIEKENSILILESIDKTAETYSETLTLQERDYLINAINTQSETIEKEKKILLDRIASTMSKKTCTGFCNFKE